jgi:hypothetical protein
VDEQSWSAQQPGAFPPAGPPPGGGAIALTLKYHPIAFTFGLFKPQVQVNGYQVATGWGRQVVPVPAGQHHVHAHIPYLLPPQLGPADLSVAVHPGQTVELEYRAPMIGFMKGALGAPPQKHPGMAASIVMLVISLLILLCVCGGIIVSAISNSSDSAYGLPALGVVRDIVQAGNIL